MDLQPLYQNRLAGDNSAGWYLPPSAVAGVLAVDPLAPAEALDDKNIVN